MFYKIKSGTTINLTPSGDELSVDANVGTAAGTVCAGNDSRLTNPRTPNLHAESHSTGQPDAISAANIGAASAGHGHSPASIGAADAGHGHSPASIGAADAGHVHSSFTGSFEFCQGLFYKEGALWKHAWRIDIVNGIVTNVVSLGDYPIV